MQRKEHLFLVPIVVLLSTHFTLWAATDYNDGQIYNVYYPVNGPVRIDYQKPGMGSTVNWYNGASIVNFIRPGMAVYNDATFNMYGGVINQILYTFNKSKANIYGGRIVDFLDAGQDSVVNIYNAVLDDYLYVVNRSVVTIYDVTIKENVRVYDKGHLTIEGGEFGGTFTIGSLQTDTAILTMKGYDFKINGQNIGYGIYYASDFASGRISGVLLNADHLNNNFEIIGNSCIVLTPEPATLSLLALGGFILSRKRK